MCILKKSGKSSRRGRGVPGSGLGGVGGRVHLAAVRSEHRFCFCHLKPTLPTAPAPGPAAAPVGGGMWKWAHTSGASPVPWPAARQGLCWWLVGGAYLVPLDGDLLHLLQDGLDAVLVHLGVLPQRQAL